MPTVRRSVDAIPLVAPSRVVVLLLSVLAGHAAAAASPPSRGETLFRQHCIGCHSISCNRNGPKLKDLIGRKAGSVSDFAHYSESLKSSGLTWSADKLIEFLADPGKVVPGTSMTVVSIKDVKDRRAIVEFIKRQDTSVDFCF